MIFDTIRSNMRTPVVLSHLNQFSDLRLDASQKYITDA
jgi:hypothetical protein